ncbi:DNA polymerase III delta subunit [Microbacteriaceae bacterium MWH-Ta3]|nr:DNA polymerase III delta subunit [Microbacteriaceae bacterium MWH-Ta3]
MVAQKVPWHGVREAPVVLVSGSESYLADRVLREMRDRLRSADPELEVTDLDASQYQPAQIFDYASPSLFGEPRLIRITGAESCTDDFIDDALRYLENPVDDVVVMIRHGGGNRGKRLLDALRTSDRVLEVECAELKKDVDRQAFVRTECGRLNARIEEGGVRALIEAFAGDLGELAAAVRQIVDDAGDKSITKALVDDYYGGRHEVTAFAVVDAAVEGRRGEALGLLRHALNTGADPVPLIAVFALKLRQLAKVGGFRGRTADAAKELGMQGWQVENARRSLSGWDEAGLGRAILAVAAADSQVKGAGRDPVYAVENVVDIVSRRGRFPVSS